MILLLWLLLLTTPAQAVQPSEMLHDPVLEARARIIGHELRCMVCQNEDIDSSEADFAHDMRMVIRERLAQGQSDQQIVAYIRSRYGDFVLMKPPLEKRTALLWAAPFLALGAGGGIVVLAWRRPKKRHR
jgi:cytochrome c-type biogenesis protein CcmH